MKKFLSILFSCVLVFGVFSFDIPDLKGRVNDYADIISSSDEQELNSVLVSLEKSIGAQGVVLTVDDLQGESIEVFALETAEEWELGQKGDDNGFLLLVTMEEREVRFEIGYGLEGILTDAKSGYIIRNTIIPLFKRGDFSGGIKAGTLQAAGLLGGDLTISTEETSRYEESSSRKKSSGIPVNLIFIVVFFVLSSAGRGGRRRRRGGGLWSLLFWSSMFGSGGRRHHHTPFGGGGSSFGGSGFGGGGFSGGGGGFGGGGASGGW